MRLWLYAHGHTPETVSRIPLRDYLDLLYEFEHGVFGPYADALNNYRLVLCLQVLAGVEKSKLPKFADLYPRVESLWSKQTPEEREAAETAAGNLSALSLLDKMERRQREQGKLQDDNDDEAGYG